MSLCSKSKIKFFVNVQHIPNIISTGRDAIWLIVGKGRFNTYLSGFLYWLLCNHYSEVIMSAMASQIISLTIVYSTVYIQGADKTSKLRVTGLCTGNSMVTDEFPPHTNCQWRGKCFHLTTSSLSWWVQSRMIWLTATHYSTKIHAMITNLKWSLADLWGYFMGILDMESWPRRHDNGLMTCVGITK